MWRVEAGQALLCVVRGIARTLLLSVGLWMLPGAALASCSWYYYHHGSDCSLTQVCATQAPDGTVYVNVILHPC